MELILSNIFSSYYLSASFPPVTKGPEGHSIFFWWVRTAQIPKSMVYEVGFPWKMGVLGAKILRFCIWRTKILAKYKAKMAKFFWKNWQWGGGEHIDGKLVGWVALTGLKGGHDHGTSPYHLPKVVPPLAKLTCIDNLSVLFFYHGWAHVLNMFVL